MSVIRSGVEDDIAGDLWPLELLAPCKLLFLPYRSHVDKLVLFSRFAVLLLFAFFGGLFPKSLQIHTGVHWYCSAMTHACRPAQIHAASPGPQHSSSTAYNGKDL